MASATAALSTVEGLLLICRTEKACTVFLQGEAIIALAGLRGDGAPELRPLGERLRV